MNEKLGESFAVSEQQGDSLNEKKEDSFNQREFKQIEINTVKNALRMVLLLSIACGVMFSLFFYKNEIGISATVFIGMIVTTGIYLFQRKKVYINEIELKSKQIAIVLVILSIALSTIYWMFDDSFLNFCNFFFIAGLMLSASLLYSNRRRNVFEGVFWLGEIIKDFFVPLIYTIKPFAYVAEIINRKQNDKKMNPYVKKTIIGLLVSIPILVIIVPFLTSADAVFEDLVNKGFGNIFDFLSKLNIGDVFGFSILAIFVCIFIFGHFYNILCYKTGIKRDRRQMDYGRKKRFDTVIFITIASVISLVYILFSVIQFSYLFSGNGNIPNGLGYAEYARRGFFELMFVSSINYLIILFGIFMTSYINKAFDNTKRILLFIICGSTYVMLFSSLYRMNLYQLEYGYTRLRVFVFFALMLESILLLMTLIYIIKPRFNLFRIATVTIIIAYIGLNFFGIDGFIARRNIERYYETGKLDHYYLYSLSYNAIPEIIQLLEVGDEEIKSETNMFLGSKYKIIMESKESWFEFNLSKKSAQKALTESYGSNE